MDTESDDTENEEVARVNWDNAGTKYMLFQPKKIKSQWNIGLHIFIVIKQSNLSLCILNNNNQWF